MTPDQTRDELAREMGWTHRTVGKDGFTHKPYLEGTDFWVSPEGKVCWDHDCPPTLDGAAAAMLDGWRVNIEYRIGGAVTAIGIPPVEIMEKVMKMVGTNCCVATAMESEGETWIEREIKARYALALACRRAGRGT